VDGVDPVDPVDVVDVDPVDLEGRVRRVRWVFVSVGFCGGFRGTWRFGICGDSCEQAC